MVHRIHFLSKCCTVMGKSFTTLTLLQRARFIIRILDLVVYLYSLYRSTTVIPGNRECRERNRDKVFWCAQVICVTKPHLLRKKTDWLFLGTHVVIM